MTTSAEHPKGYGTKESIPDSDLKMSEEEIAARKAWLELDNIDEKNIALLDGIVSENVDALMDHLYDHFLAFEDTRSFFPTEEILNRAKKGQRDYFLKLTCGSYDREYVNNRILVGATHYRVGLDTRWYLGAYYRALNFLRKLVRKNVSDDRELEDCIIESLMKLIFFDMGLAIDTYNAAKMQAIREHKDLINSLETERTVTKSIVENAPIGIARLSNNFHCLEANSEFIAITGEDSPSKVIGRSIFELCPDLPRNPLEEAVEQGTSRQSSAHLLSFTDSETDMFYDWSVWPVREKDESVSGLVVTFTQVTDTVKLQQQREDFVATLTHDLKTPILAANRALKLLMEGDFGPIQDSQKSIIETILQSNAAMYQMVLTLLDVYKYDSGVKQLNMIPVDLAEVVGKMVDQLSGLAKQKDIDLSCDLNNLTTPVLCDIDEIRRVLQNLLDNSLKYTPRNGFIRVTVQQDSDITTISVSDSGKGISEEDQPKLFQRFWQASSGGRYYASTGLGLYLCRKIAESHGGKIWCESELGKGSTFSFSLPTVEL